MTIGSGFNERKYSDLKERVVILEKKFEALEDKTRNESASGCKKNIDYEWCRVWEKQGECIGCENYIQP